MEKAAVDKARDRLTSAKAHLNGLESSKDYDSARRHWYDFLLASNAAFSVLEQGSKGTNASKSWFGRQKCQRKQDPLLRYLHHARNADEHNIASVTELDRQKIVFVEGEKPIASIEGVVGNRGTFQHLTDQPPDLRNVTSMRVYPDRAKLIRVVDRGKEYEPPAEHLGSAIDDGGLITIARLMVQYVEQMIAEAECLTAKLRT